MSSGLQLPFSDYIRMFVLVETKSARFNCVNAPIDSSCKFAAMISPAAFVTISESSAGAGSDMLMVRLESRFVSNVSTHLKLSIFSSFQSNDMRFCLELADKSVGLFIAGC